jgi:hypothetical protein
MKNKMIEYKIKFQKIKAMCNRSVDGFCFHSKRDPKTSDCMEKNCPITKTLEKVTK